MFSGDEMYPKWIFKESGLGNRHIDPAEDYFFEQLPAIGAVIRESTQNSLDASNGPQVRMRISVNQGNNAMQPSTAKKYFEGLFQHLDARENDIETPNQNLPMNFIVIEDFGTKGLEGDAEYYGLGHDAPHNRFYWFHRNTNRTNKNLKKRGGSYGYGKHAFANASKIKTFISVSRDREGIKIFGNSVVKNHEIDNKIFSPYGDFGELKSYDRGEVVIPSNSENLFNQICNDFRLSRGTDIGLSVIIPYPKKIYTEKEIIESMIRAYFLPICQGKLVVEIVGSHTILINSDSILNICRRQAWAGKPAGAMVKTSPKKMEGLIKLARWWCSKNINEISLNPPSENKIHWTLDLIPSDLYDTIRSRLDSGKPIALNVEIPIFKKLDNNKFSKKFSKSKFTILIQKDDSFGKSDVIWIRRFLSVPKPAQIPQKNGFIAIIISEEGDLEELLRASEEVAHTEHRKKRIEKQYRHGPEIIDFYRKSASMIIEFLQSKKERFEKDWIDDWFPSEEIESLDKPRKKRRKKKKIDAINKEEIDDEIIIGPPPPPEDLTDHHMWNLDRINGGFSVHGEIKLGVDYIFKIKMGYNRDDGKDPIKKWKAFDFQSDELHVEVDGVEISKLEGNIIEFRAIGPTEEYSIDVTGFDPNRDLTVHCRPRIERGGNNDE